MDQKGIAGTTALIVLGLTVFVIGIAMMFFDPLAGGLMAIAGSVQISGGLIAEAVSKKHKELEELQNAK